MKSSNKPVTLIASGDLRLSANQVCWPAQTAMESALSAALNTEGFKIVRGHPFKKSARDPRP